MDTVAKFVAYRQELAVRCPSCRHSSVIDLQRLVDAGRGERLLARLKTRCRVCGGAGRFQVRPPEPYRDGYEHR